MIPAIISGVVGLATTWLTNKKEEAQAKHERKVQMIRSEADWDAIMAQNTGTSWKDEWLTIILTAPFVTVFIGGVFDMPWLIENVKMGFEAINETIPDEYWYLLGVVVAASFGIKKVADVFTTWRK